MAKSIEVGQRFSRRHTFDEDQVHAFACAAGDENPLHHDADHAARSRFGRLIVSGTHTTALLMGLAGSHFASAGEVVGMLRSTSTQLHWINQSQHQMPKINIEFSCFVLTKTRNMKGK